MRVRRKTIYGKITSKGELQAYRGELDEFCKLHPDRGVIIRVEIQPKEPSERTANYYFGYIVPEMQNVFMSEGGEHLSKAETDFRLRENCPICIEETRENGKWRKSVKDFEMLDQAEANEFIEWIFQWASENYYKILDNPICE